MDEQSALAEGTQPGKHACLLVGDTVPRVVNAVSLIAQDRRAAAGFVEHFHHPPTGVPQQGIAERRGDAGISICATRVESDQLHRINNVLCEDDDGANGAELPPPVRPARPP